MCATGGVGAIVAGFILLLACLPPATINPTLAAQELQVTVATVTIVLTGIITLGGSLGEGHCLRCCGRARVLQEEACLPCNPRGGNVVLPACYRLKLW